jgi:RNA polymerase sigma factor for flagellar operon FliA
VIALYYYNEATMKQIGAEIGVNESRVSQLHARAIQRLRKALGAECQAEALAPAILSFQNTIRKLRTAKAQMAGERGVVLPYKPPARTKAVTRRSVTLKHEPAVAAAR